MQIQQGKIAQPIPIAAAQPSLSNTTPEAVRQHLITTEQMHPLRLQHVFGPCWVTPFQISFGIHSPLWHHLKARNTKSYQTF